MNEQEQKPREINITVDNEQTKALANELAREKLRSEHLVDVLASKEVQNDHNDLATRKLQVYQKFGDSRALDCETTEDLRNFVTQKINDASKPTPAGSPLVPQQMGIKNDNLWTHPYGGYKEMIADLRQKARNGSKEAESYLNSLYDKLWIKAKNERLEYKPSTADLDLVKTKDGFTVATNESELQHMFRMWREERLSKMGVNQK